MCRGTGPYGTAYNVAEFRNRLKQFVGSPGRFLSFNKL